MAECEIVGYCPHWDVRPDVRRGAIEDVVTFLKGLADAAEMRADTVHVEPEFTYYLGQWTAYDLALELLEEALND